MKIRLSLTLAGLAIGFAVATFAQQQNTPDPILREQVLALAKKIDEAWNSNDAAALAALFTDDAIEVRDTGPIYGRDALQVRSWPAEYRGGLASGREALQKRFEADFATNPGKMVNQLVQLYPIGSAICEITNSDVGGWKAQTVAIWVRDGDTWKSRMTYVNNQPNVVDPQLRQQIEAPFLKFQEAYNNRDAAAIGALLTQDAIEVRSWQGLASGREAQEKMFETDFATDPGKMVNKLVALYPTGSAMCEIADSDVGEWKGQTMVIYVRDGNTWKRCMAYVNDQR